MDTHDWRAELLPHIRQTNVNEIMTKLKIHHSHGDDDESLDVQKISKSIEQKTYAGASSQEDYLQKISFMMRLIDSCRWRARMQPACRQIIVNKITDLLKKHLPFSDEEGLAEVHRIALRFEERIYTEATSQVDYLRKIFLKMLTLETMNRRGQNTVANSMPSNFGPSETGSASGAQVVEGQVALSEISREMLL